MEKIWDVLNENEWEPMSVWNNQTKFTLPSVSGSVFLSVFPSGPGFSGPERAHASGAGVGGGGADAGGGAAGAQVRRVLRGLLPQQQVHRQRGLPARHDHQRLGLEGDYSSSSLELRLGEEGANYITGHRS